MVTDLEARAEKYESKAARCYDLAFNASEGPQRSFFEVLANYYAGLAADFRQAIARRRGGWLDDSETDEQANGRYERQP
jgi:hypothetical protein